VVWRKSRRSTQNGECVEVAVWRKSRRSGQNGECVEVGTVTGAIAVRDSKHPNGPKLIFSLSGWQTFADQLAHGQLSD
jgi:hypothetical protein